MVWALNLVLLVLQTGQVTTPVCGGENRDRDIGNGFSLTQYMFDGASKFSLAYRPPASTVKTVGVQAKSEFQLLFSDLQITGQAGASALNGPHVGFAGYYFVRPDGFPIGINNLQLECGGDIVLARNYPNANRPAEFPVNFPGPFFNQPEQQCIQALIEDGTFRFSAAHDAETTLSVIVEDRVALDWAIAEAGRIWREQAAQARDGRCRLMPPLPRHTTPPPPPPPPTPF